MFVRSTLIGLILLGALASIWYYSVSQFVVQETGLRIVGRNFFPAECKIRNLYRPDLGVAEAHVFLGDTRLDFLVDDPKTDGGYLHAHEIIKANLEDYVWVDEGVDVKHAKYPQDFSVLYLQGFEDPSKWKCIPWWMPNTAGFYVPSKFNVVDSVAKED